jgi:hypothetical protein
MKGLHGQAQQQAALSQRNTALAERSPAATAVSFNMGMDRMEAGAEPLAGAEDRPPSAPPEAAGESIREEEPEALDEGLIGVQPFNLQEFGTGSGPPRVESFSLPESEAEPVTAAPTVDPDLGGFVIERTAYAEIEPSEPAPAASLQSRRTTDVIPLFSSLTPDEFSEVVDRMIPLQYPSGYRIVKEGDAGNSVYLISQGSVRVLTRIGNREIPLSELKENDFFGEVGFLTGRPRTASVITQVDTEVLELRGEDLKAIIQKFPRVREVLEGFYKARVKDALSKIKHPGP